MFDWNDEELTNIIWAEDTDSGDHIVPYPGASEDYRNKKEWNQEAATIKPTEQRTAGTKIDLHGRKLESSSNLSSNEDITTGFDMDSWPDLSLPSAVKAEQDSMGTEISNYNSSREIAQLDKDTKVFQNTDEGKEQGDIVDYDWANIGSFDDLDRIFSNDDPLFGNVSLGNADELWSSSKDVANSPVKPFPMSMGSPSLVSGELRNASEPFENKTSCLQHDDLSFTAAHGKIKDSALHDVQNALEISDHVEYALRKSKRIDKEQTDIDMVGKTMAVTSHPTAENVVNTSGFIDKAPRQTKVLKGRRKSEEKSEAKATPHVYGSWSPSRNTSRKFENQLAPSMLQSPLSSMLSQQMQIAGPDTLQYQHVANSFVTPAAFGNLTNPYPAMPILSHIQSADHKHQPLLSAYEGSPGGANPISKSLKVTGKPLTMTPQEKIEKLRRRQQMQAMLAIKKQQQQFSHQVPSSNNPINQIYPADSQHLPFEEADLEVEDINTVALDPNSPIEQDDSNTVLVTIDDYSLEDSILHRLQDIISKLDMKLRLCIRDSLFRLAQSSLRRNCASDTSSTNKSTRDEHEVIAKEETNTCNRYSGIPEMETETNPIDRTVAHLLFHRTLEMPGQYPDTPESPVSAKLPCEHKAGGLVNMPMGCLPESKQNFPHQGSKTSHPLAESQQGDQFKSSPCVDTSENASTNEPGDGGAMEV